VNILAGFRMASHHSKGGKCDLPIKATRFRVSARPKKRGKLRAGTDIQFRKNRHKLRLDRSNALTECLCYFAVPESISDKFCDPTFGDRKHCKLVSTSRNQVALEPILKQYAKNS
jgi:hypothetical protein